MKLLRVLFGNLGLKFAALAFAFGIWTAVRMNLEASAKVSLQVELLVTESDFEATIPNAEQRTVTIEVVGSRDLVDDFKSRPDGYRLLLDVGKSALGETDNRKPNYFRRSQVRLSDDAPKGLEIVSMQPEAIRVDVVRIGTKRDIVVRPPQLRGADEIAEASFRIADYTPKLTARGQWEHLKDVSEVSAFVSEETLRKLVDRLGSQTTHSYSGVKLEIDPSTGGWRSDFAIVHPVEIVAKIEVTSEVERDFWVPIHIDYRGADAWSDGVLRFVAEAAGPNRWMEAGSAEETPKVLLPFAGSPREITRFQDLVDSGDVTAFVLANDVNADDGFANLRVRIEMSGQWMGVTPRYTKFPLVGVETIK